MPIKVVCINNRNSSHPLFLDKIYEARLTTDHIYYIIKSRGWWEHKSNFITLEEYRNNKIDKVCKQ